LRLSSAFALLSIAACFAPRAIAQELPAQAESQSTPQPPTLSAQSTLVLVPALVHNKAGQLIFTLKANDFTLTDDGIPQKVRLEQDSGGEPLALVVDIEGGGAASDKVDRFGALSTMLDAIVGGEPHRIAVVGFDSSPALVTAFTANNDEAERGIRALIADNNGDGGAAILDSLSFSLDLLRRQPPEYRKTILLVSETHDGGSHIALDDAMRNLSDSNTAIYAIGFSSGLSESKHEAGKARPDDEPGPAHGCMSRDPNDPEVDLNKSVAAQAYDCLTVLAPPLALARAAYVAVRSSLEKNIPETAAHLTGGEYFSLGKEKTFERDLLAISNHIPNRYVLSFQPQAPHTGFHAIKVTLPDYTGLEVSARNGYWANPPAAASPRP